MVSKDFNYLLLSLTLHRVPRGEWNCPHCIVDGNVRGHIPTAQAAVDDMKKVAGSLFVDNLRKRELLSDLLPLSKCDEIGAKDEKSGSKRKRVERKDKKMTKMTSKDFEESGSEYSESSESMEDEDDEDDEDSDYSANVDPEQTDEYKAGSAANIHSQTENAGMTDESGSNTEEKYWKIYNMRQGFFARINALSLPGNALDSLIDQLGGVDEVRSGLFLFPTINFRPAY